MEEGTGPPPQKKTPAIQRRNSLFLTIVTVENETVLDTRSIFDLGNRNDFVIDRPRSPESLKSRWYVG